MQPTAHYTAEEERRMAAYHARPPAEKVSSASNYISPEEIGARAANAMPSSSSSSAFALSSLSGAAVPLDAGTATPPSKRKRAPPVVFSPSNYERPRRTQSSAQTPITKRRSKTDVRSRASSPDRALLPPPAPAQADAGTIWRCPFSDCPLSSASTPG